MEALVILVIKIALQFILAYVGYILINNFFNGQTDLSIKEFLKFLAVLFGFLLLLDIYSVVNLFEQLKK